MNWRSFCGTALVLLAYASIAQAQALTPDDLHEIDKVAEDAIAALSMPGLAIAIQGPDGTVTTRVYGQSNIASGSSVTEDSVFRLGSISKLVTSTIVMKLVEDGELSLEQPVGEILNERPGFETIPSSVTVRHLLNHTSGLPDYTRGELESGVSAGYFETERVSQVMHRPIESQAGLTWKYSDANYSLVSLVIEQVTGMPYDRYVEQVFAPAVSLASLRPCDTTGQLKVAGYLATENGFVPEPAYEVRGLTGSGGLCSTGQDLALLPSKLADGSWIARENMEQIIGPTVLENGIIVDYGLGVRRGRLGDLEAWGHTGGGLHGAWATVAHYPATGYSVAVVANGTGGEMDASVVHAKIATIVTRPGPLTEAKLAQDDLDKLEGTYSRNGRSTCIYETNGTLFRKHLVSETPAVPLLAQNNQTFGRSDYPLDRIIFQPSEGSSPAYLVYYDGLFAEYWVRDGMGVNELDCGVDTAKKG